jgi:hypothetical protein
MTRAPAVLSRRYHDGVTYRVALPVTASTLLAVTLACAESEPSPSTGEFSCDAIVGEGYGIGQTSMDWTLMDEKAQLHSLYEFCGRPIYIEDTAAW